ncbi:YDG/SRA domain-containing protein [Nonomuraea monospora]|uniref:YDG/SRA domain-containing protein n=1 Tax=Nonomuraea monospora TaxID=568818 RepID=UPI003CD0BC01
MSAVTRFGPTPDQIEQQIRYALSRLNATNGHHLFEDVCRHFARHYITDNILPATGPVSAGGDQGRDFETFYSYISQGIPGSFISIEQRGPVVFICTLQKANLSAKIKNDVFKVIRGGPVDRIYVFCEADVPVSQRHEIIQWARQEFGLSLEILDGHCIAENLATPNTVWIAERYLGVWAGEPQQSAPSGAYHRTTSTDSWKQHQAPRTHVRAYGHVAGIPIGTIFSSRRDLASAGVHRLLQAGICGNTQDGAESVIVSGSGYFEDRGRSIIYRGASNRVEPRRPAERQPLSPLNMSLLVSHSHGKPVRVVRQVIASATSGDHKSTTTKGYRYDGLYIVSACWTDPSDESSERVWRVKLSQIDNENPSDVLSHA